MYQSHMSLIVWLSFNIAGLCSLDLTTWLCRLNLSSFCLRARMKNKNFSCSNRIYTGCLHIYRQDPHVVVSYFIRTNGSRRRGDNLWILGHNQLRSKEQVFLHTSARLQPCWMPQCVGSVGAHYWSENNHRDMFWDTISIANNKT